MKRQSAGWRLAAAAAGLLAAVACGAGGGGGGTPQANLSPITIGMLRDLDPSVLIEGGEMQANTDLAVDQINRAGGIHGHPLKVVYADPKTDPVQAIALAQQLVQQQNVDVLAGAVVSGECLGVESVISRLQVVYVSSSGCAAEDYTGKMCNQYTFRVTPQGRQMVIPLSQYIVKQYGTKWSLIYPDFAYGLSQLAAYRVGLAAAGGQLVQVIPIPRNETNMAPYITKIPTDGSVNGLINTEVTADLNRVSQTIAQFNLAAKMPIVGVFGKERFAGVYPAELNGDVGPSPELSSPAKDNPYDIAYHNAFRDELKKEPANLVNVMGGVDKAVPGDLGYQAYVAMTSLKEAMLASNFTGRADTAKLIAAYSTLKAKQGADFPGGDFVMDPTNHQGSTTVYLAKINGQEEQVLQTLAPSQLPPISSPACVIK